MWLGGDSNRQIVCHLLAGVSVACDDSPVMSADLVGEARSAVRSPVRGLVPRRRCACLPINLENVLNLVESSGRILDCASSSAASPLDAEALIALLPVTGRSQVQVWGKVDSTQRVLLDRAAQWPDRAVVVTDHQTTGRGRRGRMWISPPGGSLALSMLARYENDARWPAAMSLALGVATVEALHGVGARAVRLKWPNDLTVDNRKLGGILIETFAGGLVAGVGINVALLEETRANIAQPCIDLRELGCEISRESLAAMLILVWNDAIDAYFSCGLEAFLARWHKFDALVQRPVRVLVGSDVIEGIACGIDAQGRLQVDVDGRRQVFSSADVSVRST